MKSKEYKEKVKKGEIPLTSEINGEPIYRVGTRWRWTNRKNKYAPNPFLKRCIHEGCNNAIRIDNTDLCSKHIDWSVRSHGSSILSDEDVVFISSNYDKLSDFEIVGILLTKSNHSKTKKASLLHAVRHHRRKYLNHRYTGKFSYKTFLKKYKDDHLSCEICGWNEAAVDLHHILQEKDLLEKDLLHTENNIISLCPNHHRVVENKRRYDINQYIEYMKKYKFCCMGKR